MTKCIVCNHAGLRKLISFDKYPLCIGVMPQELLGKVPSFKLSIGLCSNCHHIQQIDQVADEHKKILYENRYSGLLSTVQMPSKTKVGLVEVNNSFEFFMHCKLPLGKVLDIGCYDGYFLFLLKNEGYDVYGVEPNPASSIAEKEYGIPVINDFFSEKHFKDNSFDIIVIRNLLEHMADVNDFLKSVIKVLKPDGYIFIEVPDAMLCLKEGALGCFFHQHLSYFSLDVLVRLLSKHSLVYVNSREDYFIYLCMKKTSGKLNKTKVFSRISNNNKEFRQYLSKYNKIKLELRRIIHEEDNIAIFGAGGNTTGLVNMLDKESVRKIKYVYDNSELKQGNLLAEIPIIVNDPSYIKIDKPRLIIISTYLHQEAIVSQIKNMAIDGLNILVLYPRVRIIK